MNFFRHAIFDDQQLVGKRILDLGCGRSKLAAAFGVDHRNFPGVDLVADLGESLPLPDGEFDVVYSNQVLEHIPNLIGLIEESHRLLRPGGIMVAHVPYFRSSWAAIDPTHIRQFTLNSLHFFVKGTYEYENYRFSDVGFREISCYLDGNYPPSFFRYFFTSLARRWPYRFENSVLSFLFPFETLTFVLTK